MPQHRRSGASESRAPLGLDADLIDLDSPTSLDAVSDYRRRGAHRNASTRGRIVIAALAAGAFAAAGAGQLLQVAPTSTDEAADSHSTLDAATVNKAMVTHSSAKNRLAPGAMGGDQQIAPDLLLSAPTDDAADEAQRIADSQQAISDVAKEKAEKARPKYVVPTHGTFTSGFAARWGTFHYGIDLAAPKDTPIVAAADGVIIQAGPASGFGLWVREQLSDGTILVYGHMDDFSVHEGQTVSAGEEIARVGNRGEATGYHLHFEVWTPEGKKIDPKPWLAERGIDV